MYSIHILHTYRFSNNNFIVYVDLQKLNKSWQWYIAYWTEGPKTLRRDVRENYRFKFGRGAIAPAYYLLFSLSLFHSLLSFLPLPLSLSLILTLLLPFILFHFLLIFLSSYFALILSLSLSLSRARARACTHTNTFGFCHSHIHIHTLTIIFILCKNLYNLYKINGKSFTSHLSENIHWRSGEGFHNDCVSWKQSLGL